jgi:hypothetical protein
LFRGVSVVCMSKGGDNIIFRVGTREKSMRGGKHCGKGLVCHLRCEIRGVSIPGRSADGGSAIKKGSGKVSKTAEWIY